MDSSCNRQKCSNRALKICSPPNLALVVIYFLAYGVACAQTDHNDPFAILEFGADTSWNVAGGAASFAPDLAVEATPIPNWLELEIGTTPFFARSSKEWDTDLLFKKPWTLSEKAEFMLGVGPEWVHTRRGNSTTNSLSLEVAGDFMFWPTGKHRYGWYLEPAYDANFGAGREKSIGMSGGLLIGIGTR